MSGGWRRGLTCLLSSHYSKVATKEAQMTSTSIGEMLVVALSAVLFSLVAQAATQQVVDITLQDPSGDSARSGMVIKTDTPMVKAGRVTLQAVNKSNEVVHEVLVVPAPS